MAAGTGVQHSEFNPSKTDPVHLLQIWIQPDHKNAPPRYEEKSMARADAGVLHLVASKSGRDRSIAMNQDADLLLSRLAPGDVVEHAVGSLRHAWVHVAEGEMEVNGHTLHAGDALAVSDEQRISITARSSGQVLVFDLN
jgi:redox-sensitive bicupin YhaK (pirin superfamily)